MSKVRFRRGQVWYLSAPQEDSEAAVFEHWDHILKKSRPWLILSNNVSNDNSDILNVVPLSFGADPEFITHASWTTNFRNSVKIQSVLCEQIYTKTQKEFNDTGRFLFTLKKDQLESVERCLSLQLGLKFEKKPTLDVLFQSQIEDYIRDVYESMAASLDKKFADLLKDLMQNTVIAEGSATEEKKVKHTWTDDEKLEFLTDCESMSVEEVQAKYNFKNKNQVYSYKSRFNRALFS